MVVTISGSQQDLLDRGNLDPTYLVDIRSGGNRLSFCTDNAIEYAGTLYQPYLSTVGTIRTAANFPDNSTTGKSFPLQFHNKQIEFDGTLYPHLSQLFDVVDWELADVDVKALLTASGERIVPGDVAMPLVTSGVAGTPSEIDRNKFIVSVATRNIKLNDSLPIRTILQGEFPEADRDILGSKTFLGLVVGSGIRIPFHPTGAGATTTVTEQVDSGTTLKISETTGFAGGDKIFIGGMVDTSFTLNAIDPDALTFTLNANLNTLGETVQVGTVVRENKTEYDYSNPNHVLGEISNVFVQPRDGKDFVAISGSLFSKVTVEDPKAIGGKRDDLKINELIPLGGGGVEVQPANSTPGGNHKHAVTATSESTETTFAGSVTPGGAGAANDGNTDTFFQLDIDAGDDEVFYKTHPAIVGTFEAQRYYATVTNPVITSGDWKIRRVTTAFLTVTVAHGKGDFRSSEDTGGSATTDYSVITTEPAGATMDLFEAHKDVTVSPTVTEDLIDLTAVDLDTDVRVSGAEIEVGSAVEAIVSGPLIPDDSGKFGPVTSSGTPIERPDGVMRYILENALGQVGIIDEDAYAAAAIEFDNRGIKLRFYVGVPTKLDALFDNIATNSQAIHYWGRKGHVIKFMTDNLEVVDPVAEMVEDQAGVLTLDAQNSFAATDIKNELTAYFDRDWTVGKNTDDSYKQSVLGLDFSSQAKYGKRTGDIDGASGNQALHFDMLTTTSGAQATLDKIVGNWSSPKKHYTVETTWAHSTLEPGDVIEIQSPLFLNNIRTRVIEVEIDPRLFCRITSRQIADAHGEHYTSANWTIVEFNTNKVLGFSNSWTWMYRLKLLTPLHASITSNILECSLQNPFIQDENRIRFQWDPDVIAGGRWIVTIWDQSGGATRKVWNWDGLLTDMVVGRWYSIFVSWDGTGINTWFGEVGSIPSTFETVSSKDVDSFVTQLDLGTGRQITTGHQFSKGRIYQIANWNMALNGSEINYLDTHVPHDLKTTAGGYGPLAASRINHHWPFCLDPENPSRDFGIASSGTIDIAEDGFIDESDCRVDAPA